MNDCTEEQHNNGIQGRFGVIIVAREVGVFMKGAVRYNYYNYTLPDVEPRTSGLEQSENKSLFPHARRQSGEFYSIYRGPQQMRKLIESLRDTELLGVAETRIEYSSVLMTKEQAALEYTTRC